MMPEIPDLQLIKDLWSLDTEYHSSLSSRCKSKDVVILDMAVLVSWR